MPRYLWFLALASCGVLLAQTGPAIVGHGYTLPTPIYAAPGQLLTLIVPMPDPTFPQQTGPLTTQAPADADLPSTLAGISANYWQGTTLTAPILEVHQFYTKAWSFPYLSPDATGSKLAAITIQIPLEAQSLLPYPKSGGLAGGQLVLFNVGVPGLGIPVEPLADQVHILTTCDPFMMSEDTAPANATGLPCPSIVTHSDGSMVSAKSPANAGEELVAYAVGLGQTNPPSTTGKLVTAAVPTQTTFGLDFSFRPNALATKPAPGAPPPAFAGATPGYVGLYQINFVVPPVPSGSPACVEPPTTFYQLTQNGVQSNLTVSVGGLFSFDAVRICVAVPNP